MFMRKENNSSKLVKELQIMYFMFRHFAVKSYHFQPTK